MDDVTSEGWKSLSQKDNCFLHECYLLLRDSKMNANYYEIVLARTQRLAFWMELAIASTAGGSGLSGLSVSYAAQFKWLWGSLALVAALCSITKPLFSASKQIELYTKKRQGYLELFLTGSRVVFSIKQQGQITDEHRQALERLFDRFEYLCEDEPPPKRRILRKALGAVETSDFPEHVFWDFWKCAASQHNGQQVTAGTRSTMRTSRGAIVAGVAMLLLSSLLGWLVVSGRL